MRPIVATFVLAITLAASSAFAESHNYSDFWGATNGATLNIVQTGETVTVTGFLYDVDRLPTWISFSGSLNGTSTFTGNVIQNAGDPPSNSWVSNWNPYSVGSASITFTSKSRGTLTLTLNGTTTTGTIRRANIAKLPLAGQYVSSVVEVLQGCTSRQSGLYSGVGYFNVSLNDAGTAATGSFEALDNTPGCTSRQSGLYAGVGYFTVTLNDAGNAATGSFEALDASPGCTYYLPFTQAGSTATGSGTFSCNDGTSGDVEVENLRAYDDIVTIQMTRTFTSGETCVATTFLSGSK